MPARLLTSPVTPNYERAAMPDNDTDSRDEAQPITPLVAFCECLLVIEALAPHDREKVASAIGSFRYSDVMKGAIDWRRRSAKWKARAAELEAELQELTEDDSDDTDDEQGAADS